MARTPEETFQHLAAERMRESGVAVGRMYKSSPRGLTVNGKLFVFFRDDRLVVKLPAARVDELVQAGIGTKHDVGGGKVQREWLEVGPDASRRWRSLMGEAHAFVAS